MTEQEIAQKILPLIQAVAEGKELRVRNDEGDKIFGWCPCSLEYLTRIVDYGKAEVRVRPEPREWWITGTAMVAFLNQTAAEEWCKKWAPTAEVIHVREVL